MLMLDVTDTAGRYAAEGYWIGHYPTAVNSTRYHALAARWRDCPSCYRSASAGTLSV
jgi:hypothetical protein